MIYIIRVIRIFCSLFCCACGVTSLKKQRGHAMATCPLIKQTNGIFLVLSREIKG